MSTIDIRAQTALDILNLPIGNYNIIKTTRAGATTSLIMACVMLGLKVFVVEPTNSIKSQTINSVNRFLEKKAKIEELYNNFECELIKQRIENNPNLASFPFLIKPLNCEEECELYDTCKVTSFIRCEDFDVVTSTYDKLNALLKTAYVFPKSAAKLTIDKIIEECDVIIFDEAHKFAFPNTTSIPILELSNYDARFPPIDISKINDVETFISELEKNGGKIADNKIDIHKYKDNLDGFIQDFELEDCVTDEYTNEKLDNLKGLYYKIPKEYKTIKKLCQTFFKIANSQEVYNAQRNVIQLIIDSNTRSHKKHQVVNIDNPHYMDFFFEKNTTKFPSEQDEIEVIKKLMAEIEKLCKNEPDSLFVVLELFKMLNVIQSEKLTIHGMQDSAKNINIDIVTKDYNFLNQIKNFLRLAQDKRILYTSATFPDYDYQKMHGHKNVEEVMFGDPLNTNSKMLIFPDTKTISPHEGRNSITNPKIRTQIEDKSKILMDKFDANKFLILCINKKEYYHWKDRFAELGYYKEDEKGHPTANSPQISYYQASDVMGVECDKRYCIAIGVQHIPKHAHDAITNSAEESQISREQYMHINAFQAWSRIKDPNGIKPSIVFALGVNKRDVGNIIKWGSGLRNITITENENDKAKEIIVNLDEIIPEPMVKIEKMFAKIQISAMVFTKEREAKWNICLYNKDNIYRQISDFPSCSFDKSSLMYRLLDVQKSKIKTKYQSKNAFAPINSKDFDKMITKHVSGIKSLYFRPLLDGNVVKSVHFDCETKEDVIRIGLHLNEDGLPYFVEQIDSKYRIWILVKEIDADRAKEFCKDILINCDFALQGKNKTVDYYPKSTSVNSHNEMVLLPFGKGSKILIDGKFVDDFDKIDVGIVDINSTSEILTPVFNPVSEMNNLCEVEV